MKLEAIESEREGERAKERERAHERRKTHRVESEFVHGVRVRE